LAGVWARGASKKVWDPYAFLQPLKLATSKSVHNLVLGLSYQITTFSTKIGGVWARGAKEKIWDPLFISATVEVNDFKFGTQLPDGEKIVKICLFVLT